MVENQKFDIAVVVLLITIISSSFFQIHQANAEVKNNDILAGFCSGLLTDLNNEHKKLGIFDSNVEYQRRRATSYLFSRGYLDPSTPGFFEIIVVQSKRGERAIADCGTQMMSITTNCGQKTGDFEKCFAKRQTIASCRAIDTCLKLDALPP